MSPKPRSAALAEQTPGNIVAALRRTFIAEGKVWPIKINPIGVTPKAYSQAIVMDLRSVLATGLSHGALKLFVAGFQKELGEDWAMTYRYACRLLYGALGLLDLDDVDADRFDEDWDGEWTLDADAYDLFEIQHPEKLDMAKKQVAATKSGRASGKVENKANAPKGKASAAAQAEHAMDNAPAITGKPLPSPKVGKKLSDFDLGYLQAVYDDITDAAVTLEEKASLHPGIGTALESIQAARDELFALLP